MDDLININLVLNIVLQVVLIIVLVVVAAMFFRIAKAIQSISTNIEDSINKAKDGLEENILSIKNKVFSAQLGVLNLVSRFIKR